MTAIGTSNYTIEAWVNLKSISGSPWILDGRYNASQKGYGGGGLGVRLNSSGQLWVNTSQSATGTGTTVLSTDTWHHIMVVRSGTGTNEFKVYLDGSLEVQGTDANSKTATWFRVAAHYGGGNALSGYVRDLRISTTARATTTPTEPVQADSDTNWLGCSLPYIADASSSSSSVTITGDLETRPYGPYDSAEYGAADHGGSIYFPVDTGARLSSASSSLELGTGNFTIEGWLYHKLNGATGSSYLFDYRTPPNSGSVHPYLYIENSIFKYGYGPYGQQITSGTVKENTWYHWAVCKSGTSTKLFLNGKQAGSTFTDNINYQGQQPYIGKHNNVTSLNAKGYLSDVRITKSDLYTADFTPPTAPLASTNSVLHMKGTDGSIIDKSGSDNLELVGDTKCTTTAVVYNSNTVSSKSMYFDGNGDGIVIPHNDRLNLNGCDWTVVYWFKVPSQTQNANWTFLQKGRNTTVRPYTTSFRLISGSGVEPRLFVSPNNSSQASISNNSAQTFGNWHHVAFVRIHSTGVITRYINGQANGTATSDVATNTEDLEIGTVTSAADEAGYIQDLRISKGKARYTSNFPLPTAELKG